MGTTVTDPLVGRLVDGRYEVVSRIARGGMATVYLAIDRRLDRDVALKVMHGHLAEGAAGSAFVARFRREAKSAARLTHPGLVAVYDQGVDGDTSYLTMEYIDGENLRRRLTAEGALSVEESLRILEEVLDALAAAHRSQLVHRDIKPENVLLATDGRVKLADFGLARAVTEVTSTTTGTVLGTVAYLAPELVAQGVSDARTDVYATGILLFELLTGRQPFVGETPIQVAFQHVNSQVPGPSELVDWMPAEIDDLVTALAAREPDDRPVDAGAALTLVRRTRLNLDPETLARRADPAPVPPDASDGGDGTHGPTSDDNDADDDPDDSPSGDSDHDDATTVLTLEHEGSTVALPIGLALRESAVPVGPAAPGRWRRRLPVLVAAAAAILAVAAIVWYMLAGPGAYTTVPDVVGETQAVATQTLTEAGLTPDVVEDWSDETKGTVVTTSPDPKGRVHKGGDVTVTVSKGPDLVPVPADLVGKMQAEAKALLEGADFTVGYADDQKHYDDSAPVGSVLKADKQPGDMVKRGSLVTLTLSDGPEPLTIFSVVGAPQAQAESDLNKAGLKMALGEAEFSDTVPQGNVIRQSPEAGTPGKRTQTITVIISKGQEMVVVPDVSTHSLSKAMTYDKAKAELEALGLKVAREGNGPLGLVIGQDPKAGASVPKNTTTVTLHVAA